MTSRVTRRSYAGPADPLAMQTLAQKERLKRLQDQYRDDPAALARFTESQSEIERYRNFGDYYSYLFVVMRPL
ncbi:MAG: hypothetical protein ACREQR_15400 [Candidatus Binataceae bacterium]